MTVIVLLLALVNLLGTATSAQKRGRSEWGWALLALVIGPLAWLAVVLAGPTEAEHLRRVTVDEETRLLVRRRMP